MAETRGVISQVLGAVVDVVFPHGELPDIYEAIRVPIGEDKEDLILEVQTHLGNDGVRTVAMDTTDGPRAWHRSVRHRFVYPSARRRRLVGPRLQCARPADR